MNALALLITMLNAPWSPAHAWEPNDNGQDTINQYCDEAKKLKCGYWIYEAKGVPADLASNGYPTKERYEEGAFSKNRKHGMWIKYWDNGTPKVKGSYVNGKPMGDYQKFSEDGKLIEEGTWDRTVGQKGELTRWNEVTGKVSQKFNFNDEGKQEGKQEEFFPDGTPWLVYEKKDNHNVGKKTEYYPTGEVKSETVYNSDGTVKSEQTFEPKTPQVVVDVTGSGLALEPGEKPNGSEKFNPNGFNTLFNKDGDLSKVGNFKNGKFFSGKRYRYDDDGILLKVEVWKNGKYHSDTQE